MSLLKKSSAVTRFTVNNFAMPASEVMDNIKRLKFMPIDDSYVQFSYGFVSLLNYLDNDFNDGCVFGDYAAVSIRYDERKVQPSVLKKCVKQEEERIKKDRQIPKLSRAQRLEIKENIKLMLMKKAVPAPSVFDVVISLHNGVVCLFTGKQKEADIATELFKLAFGAELIRQTPGDFFYRNCSEEAKAVINNHLLEDSLPYAREFLTWLFFRSNLSLSMPGDITISPLSKFSYSSPQVSISLAGEEIKEAIASVADGKQIDKLSLQIVRGAYDWQAVIRATDFLINAKLPRIATPSEDNEEDGFILDQIGMHEQLFEVFDILAGEFSNLRFSDKWADEQQAMMEWASE